MMNKDKIFVNLWAMITPVAKRQNSKLLYSNAASMIWLLALRTDTTTLYVTMLHIYTFTHCLHYKVKSNPSSVVEQICSLETWSLCIYYYTNPLLTTSANNNTLKLYPQIIQVVAERKNVNREIWMLFKLSKTGQVKMLVITSTFVRNLSLIGNLLISRNQNSKL